MKRSISFIVLSSLVFGLFCGVCYSCRDEKRQVVSVEYFKNGQILEPDYACPDSMIVVNADKLNKDMALIEQGFIDATDGEIDSIIHLSCEYYEGSYLDQFTKLKALCPSWDSLQIDQAIKED